MVESKGCIFLALIVLMTLTAFVASVYARGIRPVNETSAQAIPEPLKGERTAPRLRYLALGDSYTIGESVSPLERFPAQLVQKLRACGFDMDEMGMIARTGWTTDELDNAMDLNEPQGTYDLVTLLIGVNNQYRGREAEGYRPEFMHLLQRAIGYAGNRPERVIVVSIPDWGMTPFGRHRENVAAEIDAFNAVNRAETLRVGAHYVDITPISRKAIYDPALIANDGLHPSGKMYARWVKLILPIAVKALRVPS